MQGIVNLHPAKPDALFSRGENMIYRSQEPLRILGDLGPCTALRVTTINSNSEMMQMSKDFQTLPRLEKPLKAGDFCYLFANSRFYIVKADKR